MFLLLPLLPRRQNSAAPQTHCVGFLWGSGHVRAPEFWAMGQRPGQVTNAASLCKLLRLKTGVSLAETATHVGHGFKHWVPQSSLLAFLRLELSVVPVTDIGCFPLVIQYAPNKTMVTYGDRYWIECIVFGLGSFTRLTMTKRRWVLAAGRAKQSEKSSVIARHQLYQ